MKVKELIEKLQKLEAQNADISIGVKDMENPQCTNVVDIVEIVEHESFSGQCEDDDYYLLAIIDN